MKKIFHFFQFIFQLSFYWMIYPLAFLIYRNKSIWLISERGDDARDNGYWMFKHLRKEHMYVNAYYVIKKKSTDYQKVNKYGNVIRFGSFKHWLMYPAAECRMSTHLAAFAPGRFLGEWFKHHKQRGINVFLQHGITHNEFLSNYYKHNGSDLFICGAKPEYEFLSKNNGYPATNIVYTGFPRFDGLHNFNTKKQILIMPSWRSYLRDIDLSDFRNSIYFKSYSSLLRNDEFLSNCRKNNIKVIFYPHYSLQKFVSSFVELSNDVVTIADFDHYDVQQLLKESALLITDYSSILFDFAYMKKPQLLFQFDENEFYGKHYDRSYFDHKRDGFGTVCNNLDELIENCTALIRDNFNLPKIYLERINSFFEIYDQNNCERVYQAIVSKYIEKKKCKFKLSSKNIVVTGDDYGRNFESSEGIRQAYKLGYIQKISVMVNKDEKDILSSNLVDVSDCGLHINLLEGYASYGETTKYAYSVNDKNSIARNEFNTRKSFYTLSNHAKEVIKNEVEGQIKLYKSRGFECNHFDSHGHSLFKIPFAKTILPIMKKEGFQSTRITMNINRNTSLIKRIYKRRVAKLIKKDFISTDFFTSCDEFIHIKKYKKYKNRTIEIMTHPYFDSNIGLVNRRDISFINLYKLINSDDANSRNDKK